MDADLNRYDVEHVCTGHARMSRKQWEEIYRESWSLYYTPKHMETLLRRAVATGRTRQQPHQGAGQFRDCGVARERASAAGWHSPAQASFGAPPRSATR